MHCRRRHSTQCTDARFTLGQVFGPGPLLPLARAFDAPSEEEEQQTADTQSVEVHCKTSHLKQGAEAQPLLFRLECLHPVLQGLLLQVLLLSPALTGPLATLILLPLPLPLLSHILLLGITALRTELVEL